MAKQLLHWKNSYTGFSYGIVRKVYVKFSDEQIGLKTTTVYMKTKFLGSIEKCEAEISIKKGSASKSIKRNQFPLTQAHGNLLFIRFYAQVYNKVLLILIGKSKNRIREYKKSEIKVNKHDLFFTIKRNNIRDDAITVFVPIILKTYKWHS